MEDDRLGGKNGSFDAQLMPHERWGQWAKVLFAIGLFDAGLLGALCISLATSWALGEVFGCAHSLNRGVREAPWFYVAYVAMLMSAGVVSLIASIDIQNLITIFVQVVASARKSGDSPISYFDSSNLFRLR